MTWTVSRCFAPWWRVIQPTRMSGGRYRSRRVVRPDPQPANDNDEDLTFGEKVAAALWVVLSLPLLLGEFLVGLLLTPFLLVELIALGAGGSIMSVLRRIGLARHRVEVVGRTGHKVHSPTTLLVRGDRETADRLVTDIKATLADATEPYQPRGLPPNVTVRSHKSALRKQSRRTRRPTTS